MARAQGGIRRGIWIFASALAVTLFLAGGWLGRVGQAQDEEPAFSSDFQLGECTFKSKGANPYFNLNPGYQLILEGEELDEEEEMQSVRLVITVLDEVEEIELPEIGTVKARVVEEMETADDEPAETSRNFFAICQESGDVFYFGEEVDIFNDDGSVTHEGAWRAGVDDAVPGIIMPGTFLVGARYFQEMAADVALDRAEHVEEGLEVDTEAGSFNHCVHVIETTPLEPGAESEKTYCAGVGLVEDGVLQLVEIVDNGANDSHLYFAQFGNGDGLSSEIVLTNRSSTEAVSGSVEFRGSDGLPLAVATGGEPTDHVDFNIEPLGAFRVSTDGQGALAVGSAKSTSSGPLGGVIRFSIPGSGVAGVAASQSLCRATVSVRRETGGLRSGLALRNANPVHAVTVRLSLRGNDGVEVAEGSAQVEIPPNGHLAGFVDEIFPEADSSDFTGVVVLESDDDVAVIALEQGTMLGEFTALPVSEIR